MKRIVSILLLLGAVAFTAAPLGLVGCKAPYLLAGNDAIVVNSERAIAISFETVDAFLRWEHANRHAVPSDVTKAADSIREHAPDAFRNARAVLRAYKTNRTPEQKALLDRYIATVNDLASAASIYANYKR